MIEIQYRVTLLYTRKLPRDMTAQDADVVYQGDSKASAISYANDAWDRTVRRTDASEVEIEIARKRGKKVWRHAAERSKYTGGVLKWK